MKKILLILAAAAITLPSCENKKQKEELENAEAMAAATREELQLALAERDQLLDLINEVSSGMDDIKAVEGIVAVNTSSELTDHRGKIHSDINAMRAALDERRQKLEALEANLRNSKLNNSKLQATIQSLKKQIQYQAQQIDRLTSSLADAKNQINELGQTVDSLNTTVTTVSNERDRAQEEAVQQANIANQCYYAIGNKKELKDHNIIEGGGFLRKTKIMQGEFDQTFFTAADKRTLTTLPLHSDKAKIISATPPAGSYELVKEGKQLVLRITNPAQFWGISNYLIIQID